MDRGEDSELWKLMSKYGVDVYFAGEVHSNTASQSSNVVQIVVSSVSTEINKDLHHII